MEIYENQRFPDPHCWKLVKQVLISEPAQMQMIDTPTEFNEI